MLFKIALKVAKHLGNFWTKVCLQELSKLAQSSHTGEYCPVNSKILNEANENRPER